MRCLVLSNLFLFLANTWLVAQNISGDLSKIIYGGNRYSPFESVKYQASIDVIGKHLSGILVFKTLEDSSIRTVFVNEMGVTFFDITFLNDKYIFNSIMQSLNKKAVKISLAKDLGMILRKGIFVKNYVLNSVVYASNPIKFTIDNKLKRKGTVKYHCWSNKQEIPLIENFGRKKKIISINQYYTKESSVPDSIFVQHHTVNFSISLKQIHVTE